MLHLVVVIKLGCFIYFWLVKFLAKFEKCRRNCASDRVKCGHLRRDVLRGHKMMLLPLVMHPFAVGSEKRYPQYTICWVTRAGKVISGNRE